MTAHPTFGAASPPGSSARPGQLSPVELPGTPVPPLHAETFGGGTGPKTPRTWTLELPPGAVLRTSNDRLHRMEASKVTKFLRILGERIARHQHVPRIERADILLTYIPPPRLMRDRHPLASARVEDAGALAPTGKALIDGLKDAGVFADDNYRHVRREIYQILEGTCPRGRLKLHIIEVAP